MLTLQKYKIKLLTLLFKIKKTYILPRIKTLLIVSKGSTTEVLLLSTSLSQVALTSLSSVKSHLNLLRNTEIIILQEQLQFEVQTINRSNFLIILLQIKLKERIRVLMFLKIL